MTNMAALKAVLGETEWIGHGQAPLLQYQICVQTTPFTEQLGQLALLTLGLAEILSEKLFFT
jgi:hypothetical protein